MGSSEFESVASSARTFAIVESTVRIANFNEFLAKVLTNDKEQTHMEASPPSTSMFWQPAMLASGRN
jgi:hypothetical protein